MTPWAVWYLDGHLREHGHVRRDIRAILHPAGRMTRNRFRDLQRFQQVMELGGQPFGPADAVLLLDDGIVSWDDGWRFDSLPEPVMSLLIGFSLLGDEDR